MEKTTKRRENGTGTLWQDTKGGWHIRVMHGINPATGKRRFITASGKTRTQAKEKLQERLEQLQAESSLPYSTMPTFEQYTQRWLGSIQTQVKPKVWSAYKSDVNALNSQLAATRLDKLTGIDIEYALNALAETRSSKTIHNYYIRVRQILTHAVQQRLIPTNPALQMQPPRYTIQETHIMNQGEPARAIRTIQTGTFRTNSALAIASQDEKDMWALMFTLAFETGMRQAERFGLTPSELVTIDGVHGIQINHQLQHLTKDEKIPNWLQTTHIQGNYYLIPPKTQQGKRFIPLTTNTWIKLNQRIQKHHTKPNQLIFTLNKKPLNNPQERRRWKQTLQAAGLPYTTIRAARHYFSTALAQTGAPEDARTTIMGHAKITTTAGYTHWTPQTLAALAEKAVETIH